VGFFIYRNTRQLLKMTSDVKEVPGVEKVMWSEEVYSLPIDKSKMVKTVIEQTMVEQTGIESSLDEDDLKEYLNQAINEVKKHPHT
jgi:hypothetical protein